MKHLYIWTLFLSFSALLVMPACKQASDNSAQAAALEQQAIQLANRRCDLQRQTDSLWTSVSTQLEQKLPKDMPPVDRDIFIKARNADHIRMFKSFDKIDTSLQTLVNRAGAQDVAIANQIRALQDEMESFERGKNIFLVETEISNAAAAKIFRQKILEAQQTKCQ